ncbi:MAG TPA: cytidylate kinase-like family protein [Gemmatimonadales bacterium]
MTAPPLVTITRQYGSGGSDIARLVAKALGWTLIDNEFVERVARRAGLPREEVAQLEERAPGLLERMARALAVASPDMFITASSGQTSAGAAVHVEQDEATIVKMTERVIAEAAAEGRVVLVGRGAQAVLAKRENSLHVYVIASKPWRKQIAVERLGVDPANVDRVLDETDKARDHYVKTYYGRDRHDLTNYDVVVNAETLGFEGAAGVIVAEAKRRGWT